MDIKGKRIVIIGASSGIGAATAQLLSKEGGEVILAGRSEEKLKKVAQSLSLKDEAITYALDIRNGEEVEAFFQEVSSFDYLILSAADLSYTPFLKMDLNEARYMVDTKLWGYIYSVRFGAPNIRKNGSIVLFSGLAAWRPGRGASVVATINGAIEALVRSLAIELAPIRVNAISPGITETPSWAYMSEEERKKFFETTANTLPVGHIGKPKDLAEAVRFLIGNSFITGIVLHVDGGGRLV